MKCSEYQELMQQRLDGLEPSDPAGVELHLRNCTACQSLHLAVGKLQRGLALLAPPVPPLHLAGRIADCLGAEHRSRLVRRRRVRFTLATAAAVLLSVSAWLLRPVPPGPQQSVDHPKVAAERPTAPKIEEKQPDEAVDLSQSVAEVGSVVVGAASRTTDAAVAQGRAFLPLVPSTSMPALELSPMEPSRSLKDAGQGSRRDWLP